MMATWIDSKWPFLFDRIYRKNQIALGSYFIVKKYVYFHRSLLQGVSLLQLKRLC